MAITFSSSDYVRFTSPTNALGHSSKTYAFLSIGDAANPFFKYDNTGDEIRVSLGGGGNRVIEFRANFSTNDGIWTASTTDASGIWAISYNGSSTANDPVIYCNGVSLTVTEGSTPSGTYQSPATRIDIGFTGSIGGTSVSVQDVRIYNVIKTAAQVAAIANEDIFTDQNIDESGLVFHVPFTMCKGLTYSTYAGSTLAAANEFIDRVNGYIGVPSGSPAGA